MLFNFDNNCPSINTYNIILVLNNLFNEYCIEFDNNLRIDIENNGLFNTTFDIWTFKITGDQIFGMFITNLSRNYSLIYKLIGFEKLII